MLPVTASADVLAALAARGFAVVAAADVATAIAQPLTGLLSLSSTWNDLPIDGWLKDGGRYRSRRHGSFVVDDDVVLRVPHRAHWQPVEYNALHGGLERWFEPILDDVATAPAFTALLTTLAGWCSTTKGKQTWYVEAHQFRIDTADGIGRPTPEGAHRDGVDFVAVFLVDRVGIKGGETRVFDANGPAGVRFTLSESWSLLLLDDERVIHESTPIQPEVNGDRSGHRDTLVLTFRRGGFQEALRG
jgi:hypothetical protein